MPDDDLKESELVPRLWQTLRQVFDPEIPVNIVDLGLIYDVKLRRGKAGERRAHITMTLTAPGCSIAPLIADQVRQRAMEVEEIDEVDVELVFEPPWTRERMSEAARLQLGWM
jgi:metal-sulfur cluster biosynthetic enzyme